jgi:hypothetical protein
VRGIDAGYQLEDHVPPVLPQYGPGIFGRILVARDEICLDVGEIILLDSCDGVLHKNMIS